MKIFRVFNRNSLSQECQRKFSSLYTWGDYQAGLGWGLESSKPIFETYGNPKKVMENVKQISMGRDHSALITNDGQLYTSGYGGHYQLGNGKFSQNLTEFEKVEFFKGMKIKEVACDDSYTVVLTESGEVYHMGQYYGGYFDRFIKTPQKLDIAEKVKSIACGKQFGFAITHDNNTYSWGVFDKGCQGDADYNFKQQPQLNFRFQELKHKKHLVPLQIKIHAYSTMVLMSNGKLWSCGENNCGQLALREHEGWRTDQFNHVLKPINDINIKHLEVQEFQIGQNCSVLLSKKGEVFYSGFNDKWWMVQDKRVKNGLSIAVRDDCYYVLESDGTVMISHPEDCLDLDNQRHIFANDKIQTTVKTTFHNQMPKYIGAKYGTAFAII